MENKIIVLKVGKQDYPTNTYIIVDKNKNGGMIDPGLENN